MSNLERPTSAKNAYFSQNSMDDLISKFTSTSIIKLKKTKPKLTKPSQNLKKSTFQKQNTGVVKYRK